MEKGKTRVLFVSISAALLILCVTSSNIKVHAESQYQIRTNQNSKNSTSSIDDSKGTGASKSSRSLESSTSSKNDDSKIEKGKNDASSTLRESSKSTENNKREDSSSSDASSSKDFAEFGTGKFFSNIATWGQQFFNFLGVDLSESKTKESTSTTSMPVAETSSTTANISWKNSPSIITRLYFGSSSPLVISTSTSHVTAWGIGRQSVILKNLMASTTYYYTIVPLGFSVGTTSPVYSFTTRNQ